MKKVLLALGCFLALTTTTSAQGMTESKISISGSADASMFQLAMLDWAGESEVSTLRYSYFWNGGTHVNFHLNEKLSFYSGLSIRNLGLIRKTDPTTHKYRTYNLGIPLGLKVGRLKDRYLIVGGGVDFPINYKWKRWEGKRENKTKSNIWFSKQVNPIMPYATLGYRFGSSLVVKGVYYPMNFFNDNVHPDRVANIMVLTLGFDIDRKRNEEGEDGVELSIGGSDD